MPVRPSRLLLSVSLLAWAVVTAAAPVVEPPTGASDLVIRYSEGFGEVAGNHRTVIEVWGDGRVVVQRPIFVQGSKQAQVVISAAAVKALLDAVAAHGVFELDAAALKASLRAADQAQAEAARANPGEVAITHFTDPDPTTLEVHAASYTPDGGTPQLDVVQVVDWTGVVADASKHPGNAAIVGLRDAQDQVRALLALPGLR
jgi:hypothetical protein